MRPCVQCKPGVVFYQPFLPPAGIHIMAALDYAAAHIAHDLTITSAADGDHSGPDDPHHFGLAYDVRTHDLPDKQLALDSILAFLGDVKFYAFIEDGGLPNEHIHVQLRHGILYP